MAKSVEQSVRNSRTVTVLPDKPKKEETGTSNNKDKESSKTNSEKNTKKEESSSKKWFQGDNSSRSWYPEDKNRNFDKGQPDERDRKRTHWERDRNRYMYICKNKTNMQ